VASSEDGRYIVMSEGEELSHLMVLRISREPVQSKAAGK
jgi:hypothetical protein